VIQPYLGERCLITWDALCIVDDSTKGVGEKCKIAADELPAFAVVGNNGMCKGI